MIINVFPSPMGNEVGLIVTAAAKTGTELAFPSPMGNEVGLIVMA